MLRTLLLLECDTCEAAWPTTVSPHPQLGLNWQEEVQNLESEAEEGGWNIYKNQHICTGCLATFASSSPQD